MESFKRVPSHIGIIPDGNRRWALEKGLEKKDGYRYGIEPGFALYEMMLEYGVKEATFYGFTKDNNKREKGQREAFTQACIDAVEMLSGRDANLLVIGNTESVAFPDELKKYANHRVHFGEGKINLNFLVNYDWEWDLNNLTVNGCLHSYNIPKVDLIIRWGGRRRLSGFLPVQSVYSDFYIIDDFWPGFQRTIFLKRCGGTKAAMSRWVLAFACLTENHRETGGFFRFAKKTRSFARGAARPQDFIAGRIILHVRIFGFSFKTTSAIIKIDGFLGRIRVIPVRQARIKTKTEEDFYMGKFCASCGAPLKEDAKFCASCGARPNSYKRRPGSRWQAHRVRLRQSRGRASKRPRLQTKVNPTAQSAVRAASRVLLGTPRRLLLQAVK
jgi:undecaprenyl diphosphate synthase